MIIFTLEEADRQHSSSLYKAFAGLVVLFALGLLAFVPTVPVLS